MPADAAATQHRPRLARRQPQRFIPGVGRPGRPGGAGSRIPWSFPPATLPSQALSTRTTGGSTEPSRSVSRSTKPSHSSISSSLASEISTSPSSTATISVPATMSSSTPIISSPATIHDSPKLALVIALPVAGLFVAGLLALFWYRRRRQLRDEPSRNGLTPYSVASSTAPKEPKVIVVEPTAPPSTVAEPQTEPTKIPELEELHSAIQRAGMSVQALINSLRLPRADAEGMPPPDYGA